MQVGINVPSELLKRIDETAKNKSMSRSRYVVYCTEKMLSNVDNSGQQSGQLADIEADNALAREVETLNSQLVHKDEIIKISNERMQELENTLNSQLVHKDEIIKIRDEKIQKLENDIGWQVDALNAQLGHKEELIKIKDESIRKLEDNIGWLRSEYSKKDAQLSQFLLPSAEKKPEGKKSIWDKILRRNKTIVS